MIKSNLRNLLMIIIIISFNGNVLHAQYPDYENFYYPTEGNAYEYDYDILVWSDEFDVDGPIDTSKWFHQTKLPNGSSWYNNEIQHYTNRINNSFNDTGYMHIVAKKETFTDQGVTKQYTSARLNSKFAFTYGKVEIRAKLPFGVGTWPAMWTLGKNVRENGGYWYIQGFGTTGWPACGEIDIMEHWGSNQDYVSSAMHTPSSYGGTVNKGGRTVPDVSTEFHVYKFEWTPEKMVFSIDDVIHYTYNPEIKDANTWPFDVDQYLLLNVAILPSISAEFIESALVVDYVRVYQESITSVNQHTDSPYPVSYPNPFKNEINIDLGEFPKQDIKVKIYNSTGLHIKSYTFPNAVRVIKLNDFADLSSGLYIISFELNNKIHSLRVAKK